MYPSAQLDFTIDIFYRVACNICCVLSSVFIVEKLHKIAGFYGVAL